MHSNLRVHQKNKNQIDSQKSETPSNNERSTKSKRTSIVKITNFVLLFAITLFVGLQQPANADFKKTKIAVLDFQLQGEKFDNPDMDTIVAEWFITAMVREGRFDVVERRLLEKILKEQKLAMTGVVNTSGASELGKLLGVKVIITGSVMKLKNVIEINSRIIDVETGSIITAEHVKSSATARLQDLVVQMSRKIMKNFPLEGYIVNRSGEKVTLDLGIRTGVKSGMRFVVYKEGQIIKHPKTGQVLDVERIETGAVRITRVMKKISSAKIEEETSPGSINYGQLVKSLMDTTPKVSRLFVNSSPEGARIRILNITPKFTQGIVLSPGAYHLEVSAPGYRTMREWINLGSNEEKTLSFTLVSASVGSSNQPQTQTVVSEKVPINPPPPPPGKLTAQQRKFINMLQSGSIRSKKDAAKLIYKSALTDTVILDVLEQELLQNYLLNGSDRHHIDTMSWYCKALGASGLAKYRKSLQKVADNGPHRKLRGYAKKSLSAL